MDDDPTAEEVGRERVGALRRVAATKLAEVLRRDPDLAADAAEVGLVDRRWLDDPGEHPISTATKGEVLERFLERAAERRPSILTSLGLTAVQALSSRGDTVGATAQPVTVVFTDLEGFTSYNATHGDAAAVELLGDHHRLAGPIVRSRGGRIVKRLGDGLLLAFPEPGAAVLAAVELLGSAPEPLRLRAGVHTGEALVTRDDLTGHVVNVAARVTEEAKGGSVLVTGEVVDSVGGELRGVSFGRATAKRLKGIPEKVRVVQARPAD